MSCNILNEDLIIEVNANSKNFAAMEKCIDNIIDKKNVFINVEKLRKLLNKEFSPTLIEKINIIEIKDPRTIFQGAFVYPSQEHLEDLSKLVLTPSERETYHVLFEKCIIEIDERMFYDLNLSSKHILAVILHELGHTLNDRKLLRPKREIFSLMSLLSFIIGSINLMMGGLSFILGYMIAYFVSLKLFNKENDSNEIEADNLAVISGYGQYIYEALDTLIIYASDDYKSVLKNKTKDAYQVLKFTTQNIKHLNTRKQTIIKNLEKQIKEEVSPYRKELLQKQINALKVYNEERKTTNSGIKFGLNESYLEESVRSFMEINKRGYSMLEVDEIEIEIGRIETSDDKLYLVQRIHKDVAVAKKAISKLTREGRTSEVKEIELYIEKLMSLLPKIKQVKTEITPYSFKVQYPKGDYEE